MNDLMSHINFFESTEVTGFMSTIRPIIWSLLLIGIVVLGYNLMFNRSEKKSQIPINLLCFVLIITGLPTFLTQISNITTTGIQAFQGSNSVSSQILKSCVQGLSYYDENDFSVEALQQKNNIAEEKIEKIDPATLMKPKDCKNDGVFSNQISFNTDGTEKLTKLSDGLFGWDAMSSYYYRYKIDWLAIYISLIAMFLALLFAAIKTGKIIFEIGFNGIFLLFVAPLDLTVGQRLKKCVMELLSLFLVLICMCLVVRVYVFGVAWVSETFEGLSKAICLLGFSWGMIDAPNIIQKILGIDAGLSSGFKTMASVYYASRTAWGAAKGAASVAKKAAGAGTAAMGYTAGTAKGIYDFAGQKQSKKASHQETTEQKGKISGQNIDDNRQSTNGKETPVKEKGAQNQQAQNQRETIPDKPQTDKQPEPKTNVSSEDTQAKPNTSTPDMDSQHHKDGQQEKHQPVQQGVAQEKEPPKKKDNHDYTTTLGDVVKNKLPSSHRIGQAYDVGRNTALQGLQKIDGYVQKQNSGETPSPSLRPESKVVDQPPESTEIRKKRRKNHDKD